jgi:hypothetical protein
MLLFIAKSPFVAIWYGVNTCIIEKCACQEDFSLAFC